jgi:hypothetical protein
MKKAMTVLLAAALVFAAAGQASATALETSGEYRGRFWYLNNYSQIPAEQDSQEFWDQRLRLGMNWKVTDTVKVGARADILENVWNTAADAQEIDFDWAYVQFMWGQVQTTVGKQDVSWGPGVYAKADNRYRFKVGTKFGEIPVGFAYDKLAESGGKFNEDDHGYTLNTIIPVGGWNLGVLGIYRDNNPIDADFLAIDVTAAGAIGPAKISFEGAYGQGDFGKLDQDGLMAYAGAFLPLGPVNCGFEFGYAKGDGDANDDEKNDALFHDYNGPFNSFILFNNFDLDGWNSTYSGGADKGLNNAMALKASATFAFSKQLSLMGAAVWAQADEKGTRGSDDMGIEFDALLKYAMTENVTLQTGIGYLAAGDYYEVANQSPDDPMVVTAHAVVAF